MAGTTGNVFFAIQSIVILPLMAIIQDFFLKVMHLLGISQQSWSIFHPRYYAIIKSLQVRPSMSEFIDAFDAFINLMSIVKKIRLLFLTHRQNFPTFFFTIFRFVSLAFIRRILKLFPIIFTYLFHSKNILRHFTFFKNSIDLTQ